MQHIGIQREDENGGVLESSTINFVDILGPIGHNNIAKFVKLSEIDPYGDTIFNGLQIPLLTKELEALAAESDPSRSQLIGTVMDFLARAGIHEYIRFIGD